MNFIMNKEIIFPKDILGPIVQMIIIMKIIGKKGNKCQKRKKNIQQLFYLMKEEIYKKEKMPD